MRGRPLVLFLVVFTSALAGCATPSRPHALPASSTPPGESTPTPSATLAMPDVETNETLAGLRIIVTGDTGTGERAQYEIADAIERVCAEWGCDAMVILGDVIYEVGVSSPNDPQFESKFEKPYANLTFPIYTVLGNHDNSYDPISPQLGLELGAGQWYESGNHMVAYHHRTDRLSDKWQMPARYYSARLGDVEFFALDTNTMVYLDVAFGSTNPEAYQDALAQSEWVDGALAASNATWKITWAHHPYVSNGEHGDAGHYDGHPVPGASGDHIKRFFEEHVCGRAQMHWSGHDHDLQWLKPVDACPGMEFLVSGAGAKSRDLAHPTDDAYFGQGKTNGFYWVEIVGDRLHGVVFDRDLNVLYERTLTRG